MFVHLRAHSSYSFLRGIGTPQMLVETAQKYGMHALALTDYHSLTGTIEFYDACNKAGIKPILGLEVNISPPPKLHCQSGVIVVLAMNNTGWSSLCRLGSESADNDPIPFTALKNSPGLICLSGGRRGILHQLSISNNKIFIEQLIDNLKAYFPDHLYIELQYHSSEDLEICTRMATIARKFNLPTIATHDIHYITPQQESLQKTLSAIRTNQSRDTLPPEAAAPPAAYFLSQEQIGSSLGDFPNAIIRSVEIAERCRLDLALGHPHYPAVECPPGTTAQDILRTKANQKAWILYGQSSSGMPVEVNNRLNYELGLINDSGYAPLFLIVEDILDYARYHGIPYSSRGSAASSLVAHCLGITSPDPIRLRLYFERFLNPARSTPPDIDTDLCSRRRDEIIKYVTLKYGKDRVATVCTVNTFRKRSALREVAKAYGLSPSDINNLVRRLPSQWSSPTNTRNTMDDPYVDLSSSYPSLRYQSIFDDARSLIGIPHHLSVHPGGIVISPTQMTDWTPVKRASKGVMITQLDLDSIERIGLVKIDLLGIRGLTVLGDVVGNSLFQHPQIEGCNPELHPITRKIEQIPNADDAVSNMLANGQTIGCFQIESPGMRATLREINAQTIDDIMVALALYRPGPLTGGMKNVFVQRHLKKEIPQYPHPALESLLGDTYGIILYQEQVLRIANEIGGLNMAEADLLRRAMSHFDPGKQMKTLKEKFIFGAYESHSISAEVSEEIWGFMAAFAGYGFPKAHAASYAQISWRSAWCKTYFPDLFMAAVLANWGGYYSQRVYITEARRLGLTIRPPHINYSQREFCVKIRNNQSFLYMGLDQIRDLSKSTQLRIISNQPFSSLIDFLVRVDPNPGEAKNIIQVSALDEIGTIPTLLEQLDSLRWGKKQYPLWIDAMKDVEDWTLAQKTQAQLEILGTSITAHPLELVTEQIASFGVISSLTAASRVGEKVRIAGLRHGWNKISSSDAQAIYSTQIEDLEGNLDVIITPEVYHQSKVSLNNYQPWVLEGIIEIDVDSSEPHMRAQKLWQI